MSVQPQAIRLRNLEFLRGLAALWVVAVHARMMGWIGWHAQWERRHELGWFDHTLGLLTFPLSWGEFGVPLFFALSGYVIHLPQARPSMSASPRPFAVWQFLARRAVKLYPALIVTLGLTALLDWATASLSGHALDVNGNWSVWVAVGQLLGLQNLVVPCFGSNGALWTLSLEMQFYVVYPLWLLALRRWGWRLVLGLSFPLALLTGLMGGAAQTKVFLAYHPAWLLGAWLAEHHARGTHPLPSRLAWWLLAAVGLVGGLWCRHRFEHGMVIFWSFTGLWMMHTTRNWTPRHVLARTIERLGAASYSIYLVHLPLLVFLNTWLMAGQPVDSPLASLALMPPCVMLGWLLYQWVEAPCNDIGKHWLAQRLNGQATAQGKA